MKKHLLGCLITAVALAVLLPVHTSASDTGQETIEISENDGMASVTLGIPRAFGEGISSLQLSLNVDTDHSGAAEVVFQFHDTAFKNAKVKEYRYNPESGVLNLYIAGTENLFSQSDEKILLGNIAVSDGTGAGQPFTVRVGEGAIRLPGRSKAEAVGFTETTELRVGAGGAPGGSVPEAGMTGVGTAAGDDTSAVAAGGSITDQQSIDMAKGYDKSLYTEESYKVLEDAVKEAEEILNYPGAAAAEKEAALQKVQNAVGALESSTPTSAEVKRKAEKGKSDSAKIEASAPVLLYVMTGLLCVFIIMAVIYGVIYRQQSRKRRYPYV